LDRFRALRVLRRGARAIRSGVDKNGHLLKPPMGYGYYSKVSADDTALIAWLRSLPAKKHP